MTTAAAVTVVVNRAAAWAVVGACGLVALLSLVAVILAWRAAREARRALRTLEEMRWTAPGASGRSTRQVPVMVPPEMVFPPPERVQAPASPPPAPQAGERPTATTPPQESPTSRSHRPPPDIARYEVRLPGRPGEENASPEPVGHGASPPTEAEAPSRPPSSPPSSEAGSREVGPGAGEESEPSAERRDAEETAVLLRALEDSDPFVRSKALDGLRGRPDVEASVLRALDDDYPIVRRSAVRALRGSTGSRVTRALVEVVSHDPSTEVREEAVGVLGDLLHRGATQTS